MKIAKGRSALALSHRRPGINRLQNPCNWGSSISFVPPYCPCLYEKKENKTRILTHNPPNNLATQTRDATNTIKADDDYLITVIFRITTNKQVITAHVT